MELPAYFLSDAHLGIDPPGAVPEREQKLVELLKSWKGRASHVVIAGDLFEFWFEYRYYVTRSHFKLFCALSELVESGVEVHLLQGNHDFAYESFFPENLGVQVHRDMILEIQGKRIYFHHGDGVPRSDTGYRIMRRILDFPLNRWLFKQIHPDWGMALARFVGRNSRKYGASRDIHFQEYLAWGESILKQKDCQMCIHGHHHESGIWNVDGGIVASSGEWIKKLTFLRMEEGELSLLEF